MKHSIIVLPIIIVLSGGLQAQVDDSGHQAYQPFSLESAYGQSVDFNYWFLIDDDIQKVMFNPARSSVISNSFITASVQPVGNTNFSVAGLLPATKGKWFYSAGLMLWGRKIERDWNNYDSNFTSNTSTDGTQYSERFDTNSKMEQEVQEYDETRVEFRLSRVLEPEDSKTRALGIFAALSREEQTGSRDFSSEYSRTYEYYESDTLRNRDTELRSILDERHQENNDNRFIAGVEYFVHSDNGDLFHKIYIQKNKFGETDESILFEEENETSTDFLSNTQTSRSVRTIDSYFNEQVHPLQLIYRGYQNFQTDWLGGDYFFVQAGARYSFGENDNEIRQNVELRRASNGNPLTLIEEEIRNVQYNSVSEYVFEAGISPGYILKKSAVDFTIFSGLNPFFRYHGATLHRIASLDKVEQKAVERRAGITIPVYGSFSLSESFKLWGGAQLSGEFSSLKLDYRVQPYDENPDPAAGQVILDNEVTINDYSTRQSLYAGLTFDHKSGFSAVANVRGNLAEVRNWFLTLRYSY